MSHNIIFVEKWGEDGIFWEGGVDSGRVAHMNLLNRGVYSGRDRYILGSEDTSPNHEKGCRSWEGGVDSGSPHDLPRGII